MYPPSVFVAGVYSGEEIRSPVRLSTRGRVARERT